MKDLLREYEIAGNGQVRVEIIDPAEDAELENEANTKYGIRAVPFQVADRYQASLVNSYFDVLVAYGSEYEVLSFRDLIEVKAQGETNIDVLLKNPEFDVTRAIKRVLYGFQGGASVFDNMNAPVRFVGYISDDSVLPEPLVELKGLLNEVLVELAQQGGDKFSSELVDPQAGDGQVALDIAAQYGFQPMAASLFDDSRFYFYLTLQNDETVVQIPIPDPLSTEALQRSVEEGLKRFASGLLKSVILNAPEPTPPFAQQQGTPPANEFNQLLNFLSSDFNVDSNDLSSGTVPADADMVVVVDPSNFDDKQVFALDQFLMKGGTVLLSSGAFAAQPTPTSLSAVQRTSGLEAWLAHHGVTIEPALVMDPQNTAFPVPVTREVGGFSFQDLVMLDYPYFIDVRDDGLAEDTPITAGLPQLTMSWASPITLNLAEGVSDTPLLQSSPGSWRSQDTNVMPRFSESGLSEFTPTSEQASQLLGVVLEGRFESYFAGRESPLLATADEPDEQVETPVDDEAATSETVELGVVSSVIERSPESARLVVFSSNDFLADQSLRMMGAADGTIYLNSVQLLTNLVDWTLEDQSLTSIRARGNFNRTLPSMPVESQSMVEYSNYLLALLGIGLVLVIFRARQGARRRQYQAWMEA